MAAALPLALAACAVGPNYRAPSATALAVPGRFAATAPDYAAPADQAELARWWTALDDPLLETLIAEALAQGPDIQAAGARLRQSRGALRSARASLLPALTTSASAGHTSRIGSGGTVFTLPGGATGGAGTGLTTGGSNLFATSGSYETYSAGLDAAYEVDLFGGVRRSVEAARGDEAAGLEQLRDTQRTIAAEVALDYVTARQAQERLGIARDNLRSQDDTVQIAGWRAQAGLVSSLDVAQARAQREQTAATIPTLATSLVQAASAIGALIGQAPGDVQKRLADVRPVPVADRVLGVDLPLAVLAHRPDVRAAERDLAAATARIGVAKAELYPALRLTGSLGGNGTAVGDISRFSTGSIIGALSAPIFDGGAIRGRIEQARGAADEALANYRKAVLTALGDVENAMAALANTREREVSLSLAVDQSRAALLYAQSQYRAGLVDFQTLLDAERTLLTSEDGLATARGDRATALVQLYKALGGGWQAAPMPASATPRTRAQVELPTLATVGPGPAAEGLEGGS
ncbi:efflux transporter outer membrane subunit [Sphingomonas sp.]|uniref:efflux transporter outer membrane subunit n=1 Tax=Sphingomonas sp. TaxID=28214 RepID=UPI003B00F9BD